MSHYADKTAFVLVADGGKAMLLRNLGDDKFLNLSLESSWLEDNPPTRALASDRPGRSYESAGYGRSAVRALDLHDETERAFLVRIADLIDDAVRQHRIVNLIVVAPPRAMAVLRASYTAPVKAAVRAEMVKDLTHLSLPQIEAHLALLKAW